MPRLRRGRHGDGVVMDALTDLELTVERQDELAPACDWYVQRPAVSTLFGECTPCPDAAVGWVRLDCGDLLLSCEYHLELAEQPNAVAVCAHGPCRIAKTGRF